MGAIKNVSQSAIERQKLKSSSRGAPGAKRREPGGTLRSAWITKRLQGGAIWSSVTLTLNDTWVKYDGWETPRSSRAKVVAYITMNDQAEDHNRRLRVLSWISTFVASVLLTGLYFGSRSVIGVFANMFAGMGVELPLLTRIAIHPWIPSLFMLAAIRVACKELFVRDKAVSLATTGFVVMAAVFVCGFIATSLYLPLKSLQQITK